MTQTQATIAAAMVASYTPKRPKLHKGHSVKQQKIHSIEAHVEATACLHAKARQGKGLKRQLNSIWQQLPHSVARDTLSIWVTRPHERDSPGNINSCRIWPHLHQATTQLQRACCEFCHCIGRAVAIWKRNHHVTVVPHAPHSVKIRKVIWKDLQEQFQALLVQ